MRSIFMAVMMFMSSVVAQDSMVTIPRSMLPVGVSVAQVEAQQKIQTYGKWVGLGKEVGIAVRDGLGALTDETDKFSKTSVGKFTMFIIAFKVLGYPIIQLFFGFLIWLVGTIIGVIYFCWFFRPRKQIDGNTISFQDPIAGSWSDLGAGGAMIVFTMFYILFCAVCSGIIFIH